jgi:hypothetical protein
MLAKGHQFRSKEEIDADRARDHDLDQARQLALDQLRAVRE